MKNLINIIIIIEFYFLFLYMRHSTHIVSISPWPLFISLNLLFMLIGFTGYMTGYYLNLILYLLSFILVLICLILWFNDIITESLYYGNHCYKISNGLIYGFLLFLLTEIMLFFSFFWAYFNSALNPIFLVWPPIGIDPLINPWSIPLLNTVLLFYGGIFATWAHHCFLNNEKDNSVKILIISIILSFIFVLLQLFEYYTSSYDITDSVYGSSFYLLTGFHGFHILIAITFLIIVTYRIYKFHNSNILLDLSLLYFHLVDVIWIGLFILIYYLAY